MLKDENTILPKQIAAQDKLNDLLATLQIVGRIGEDNIKLLATTLQIEEHVGVRGVERRKAQLLGGFTDEGVVHRVDLHAGDTLCAPRRELIADGARTREEVQNIDILEVHEVAKHIKEVLLGEVGGGACPEVAGWGDGPTAIFSTNDSHNFSLFCALHSAEVLFEGFVVSFALFTTEHELRLAKVVILIEERQKVYHCALICEGYNLGIA